MLSTALLLLWLLSLALSTTVANTSLSVHSCTLNYGSECVVTLDSTQHGRYWTSMMISLTSNQYRNPQVYFRSYNCLQYTAVPLTGSRINSTGGQNPSVLPTIGGRGADPDLFQANCSNCPNLASTERICFHWHQCSEWWTLNNTNVYFYSYFYNFLYTMYNYNYRRFLRSFSQKVASAIFDFPKNYLRTLVDFFTLPNPGYYYKPDSAHKLNYTYKLITYNLEITVISY